jgi:hypothetical protein
MQLVWRGMLGRSRRQLGLGSIGRGDRLKVCPALLGCRKEHSQEWLCYIDSARCCSLKSVAA